MVAELEQLIAPGASKIHQPYPKHRLADSRSAENQNFYFPPIRLMPAIDANELPKSGHTAEFCDDVLRAFRKALILRKITQVENGSVILPILVAGMN